MSESNELRITAILAEHATLRAEVVALVGRQSSIAYWGASSGGALLAVVLATWSKIGAVPIALPLVFFLVFPLATAGYVVAWFWISMILANLGAYIYLLERKVEAILPVEGNGRGCQGGVSREVWLAKAPMGWEHYLRFNPRKPAELEHDFIPAAKWAAKWLTAVLLAATNATGTWLAIDRIGWTTWQRSWIYITALAAPWVFWLAAWFFGFRYGDREFSIAEEKVREFDSLRDLKAS